MKSRVFFFFLLLNILPLQATAQQADSLLHVLENTVIEEDKALLYSEIGKALRFKDPALAMDYAQQGLVLSQRISYDLGSGENAALLGDLLVVDDKLEEAKKFYELSVDYYAKADKLFDVTQVQMILGNIQLAQNNYFEALKLYEACLSTSKAQDYQKLLPHLYHNTGEIFLEIGDYEEASARLIMSMELFHAQKDEFNAALNQFSLAKIKGIQGDTEAAITGLLDAVSIMTKLESWPNVANGYNSIAELYQKKGEERRAQEYLDLALSIIENNTSTFAGPSSLYSTQIYTNVAEQAFKDGQMKKAMEFSKKSLGLALINQYKGSIAANAELISRIHEQEGRPDSALTYYRTMMQFKEEAQKEDNIKKITQLRMQYEFDAMLKEKELDEVRSKASQRQREILVFGLLGFVLLTAIILWLLYRAQKSKADKAILREQNLQLERAQLDQDLEYKNKELATNMMYLLEKNEFITGIARKLSEAKGAFNKNNQDLVQQIINELKQNSSTKIWEEFEIRFKEVHAEFYTALNEKYPDLTPNEVKLCAFLRLNMSTKEISAITHQSVNSLNMARFRLRKKMDIDRDENLIMYISQL